MGNTIEYAKLFQRVLDSVDIPGKTSSAMEGNTVVYNGGDEIKLPKMTLSGLADYSRSGGYKGGAIVSEYETHKITKDRGIEFTIDVMDLDESGFVIEAGRVVNALNRESVIPEIDAYRYSKIFALANANLKTEDYTPADSDIFEKLLGNISAVENVIGEGVAKTIYMSYEAARILDLADKVEKRLDVVANDGDIKSKTRMLDGTPIVRVPSARFKSLFTFNDGTSAFGFSTAATTMELNWIILPNNAAYGVMKHDKLKIFSPDVNQSSDGWLVQYRLYHDLFIPDNKIPGLWVSYKSIAAPTLTATVAAGAATGNTKFTATAATGNVLKYSLTADSITAPKFNSIPSGLTAYVSGADITATVGQKLNMYELDANGRVMKYATHTLVKANVNGAE